MKNKVEKRIRERVPTLQEDCCGHCGCKHEEEKCPVCGEVEKVGDDIHLEHVLLAIREADTVLFFRDRVSQKHPIIYIGDHQAELLTRWNLKKSFDYQPREVFEYLNEILM